jgi:hypothetical protein
MTRILIKSIAVVDEHGGGSAYEWTVIEDAEIISHGIAPTILEAAMHAGNGTYDGWGYAKTAGRLSIVGEQAQVVTPGEAQRLAYEAPTLTYCCNKDAPCEKHASLLAKVFAT